MYAGYQKEKIVLVKDTQEELQNIPYMVFDKIEELSEPYELYKGEYITSTEADIRRAADEKADSIKELQEQLDTLDLKAIRALRAIQTKEDVPADHERLSDLEAQAESIREQLRELGAN